MEDSLEFDTWLKKLGCPESYINDNVRAMLQNGVHGLVWQELYKRIRPQAEVQEARKNILLYKIKNEPNDKLLQSVRNTVHLRNERTKLDLKIKEADETWKKQESKCRQKLHAIKQAQEAKEYLSLKSNILEVKNNEMQMQIQNCAKMQEICSRLMPPVGEEISETTIKDCLSLVSNYSGGPEKRQVWNTIKETLGPVKVEVLWKALLTARSQCTDYLIHLDLKESQEQKSKPIGSLDIGIAKFCSEHIASVAQYNINVCKIKSNEVQAMECITKIEKIIEEERPDLKEWLPLTLRARKLEITIQELQKEIQILQDHLQADTAIADNNFLMQLISDINIIDSKTVDCGQEIEKAFDELKFSGQIIRQKREALNNELMKLDLLREKEDNQWLDVDLKDELHTFNNINLQALRKIMLKGQSGTYKHLQTCFNAASVAVNIENGRITTSNFPMLRTPIYYLIDFYKAFTTNIFLNKKLNEKEYDNEPFFIDETNITNNKIVLTNLFAQKNITCEKTLQYTEEINKILNTWSNQTVREVVLKIFSNKIVYGATLDEWQKRFSMIFYILERSNIFVAK